MDNKELIDTLERCQRLLINTGGRLDVVNFLIKNKIENDYFDKAFEIAVINNYSEIAKVLFNQNINIHEAFDFCIDNNNLIMVKFILENGKEEIYMDDFYPFRHAVRTYNFEMLNILVNNYLRFDDVFNYYDEALHYICTEGSTNENKPAIIKLLLDNYANIDTYTYDDILTMTVNNGDGSKTHLEIVKILIENGAYVNYNKIFRISIAKKHDIIVDYYLSFFSKDLKFILHGEEIRTVLLKYLLKKDLSQYPKLILIYREFGIDLFDLLEKEC